MNNIIKLNNLRIWSWILSPTHYSLSISWMRHINVRPNTFIVSWIDDFCVNINVHIIIIGYIVDSILTLPNSKSSITKVLAILIWIIVSHSTQEVPICIFTLKLSYRVCSQVSRPISVTVFRLIRKFGLSPLFINDWFNIALWWWEYFLFESIFILIWIINWLLECIIPSIQIPKISTRLLNSNFILECSRSKNNFWLSNLPIKGRMPLILSNIKDEFWSQIMSCNTWERNILIIKFNESIDLLLDSRISKINKVPSCKVITIVDIIH